MCSFGTYYLAIGLFFFIVSLYIAFSDYGKIVLGQKNEQPKYKFWTWGTMLLLAGLRTFCFTLFQSGSLMHLTPTSKKWVASRNGPASIHCFTGDLFLGVFIWFWPFHLALCFTSEKGRIKNTQKHVRPLLKNKTDGPFGRLIDLTAVFSLIAGTATTFSITDFL